MKRYPISLVMKEMQTKDIMRCINLPIRTAEIKNSDITNIK